MVCYTEPGAGTFKRYLTGDWTSHLSIAIDHQLEVKGAATAQGVS